MRTMLLSLVAAHVQTGSIFSASLKNDNNGRSGIDTNEVSVCNGASQLLYELLSDICSQLVSIYRVKFVLVL